MRERGGGEQERGDYKEKKRGKKEKKRKMRERERERERALSAKFICGTTLKRRDGTGNSCLMYIPASIRLSPLSFPFLCRTSVTHYSYSHLGSLDAHTH